MIFTFRPLRFLYMTAVVTAAFAYAGWTGVLIAVAAAFDITITWKKS